MPKGSNLLNIESISFSADLIEVYVLYLSTYLHRPRLSLPNRYYLLPVAASNSTVIGHQYTQSWISSGVSSQVMHSRKPDVLSTELCWRVTIAFFQPPTPPRSYSANVLLPILQDMSSKPYNDYAAQVAAFLVLHWENRILPNGTFICHLTTALGFYCGLGNTFVIAINVRIAIGKTTVNSTPSHLKSPRLVLNNFGCVTHQLSL